MEIFQIFQECVGIGFRVEDWGLGLELQALGVCGLRTVQFATIIHSRSLTFYSSTISNITSSCSGNTTLLIARRETAMADDIMFVIGAR